MRVFVIGALVFLFSCAAAAQIAVLQIKVVDGEGAVHPPGARVAHPITVEVTGETGQPVAGAAVSFQLPPEGPSGLFSNGLRTDLVLTDANGRASIHSMQLNRTGGQIRIRITAVKDQARAGIVSIQYIAENRNSVPAGPAKASPGATPQTAPQATPETTPQTGAASGEITRTTTKVGSGSHKKWIVLAAIAAAGGAAFLGVSRAKTSNSTVSSSVVSIGTPTITIGHP
ncbi:MAG TPA: hypothetical protein VMG35_22380 [Bryobacteraceae bacterium]|nr:hypothetical protein [Bryobacteraceae bacterium]